VLHEEEQETSDGYSHTRETGMSTPSRPSANLKDEANRHRLDFITSELALCFTFSSIAVRRYEGGNCEAAEKFMAYAEEAYEAVIQFLSDPQAFGKSGWQRNRNESRIGSTSGTARPNYRD
jgi:hypothetical protein